MQPVDTTILSSEPPPVQTLNLKKGKPNSEDYIVSFGVKQLVTYTVFFITFGASVYTFFMALPKIDSLQKNYHEIDKMEELMKKDIVDIKQTVSELKVDVRDLSKQKP